MYVGNAIHVIYFKGNDEAAKALIESGADISAVDCGGLTPVMIAASTNLRSIVYMLEQRGASSTVGFP